MAATNSLGYTNVTEQTTGIKPIKLGIVSNYGVTKDTPSEVSLKNNTSPLDQEEIMSFRCRSVKSVSSYNDNMFPPTVKTGVQYGVRLDELLSHVEDDGDRIDSPIVVNLSITHPVNGYVTEAHIIELVQRTLGMLYDDNGASRIKNLMRSSLKPSAN